MQHNKYNIEIGRFLISAMAQPRLDGGFDALVSIRSGSGMASSDRVMRFAERFSSTQAALRYARLQGLTWARCQ